MLSWLSPWWLWGLGLAFAGPAVIHLLSRGRGRIVGFPALRFVEQAAADIKKIERPRQWWLMFLRIALLAAVAAALAQPVWVSSSAMDDSGACVVIVVDRSASMQRVTHGSTLFEQASQRATTWLRSLDATKHQAVVVLADRTPRALIGEPTANFAMLAEQLQTAEVTYESTDLTQAIERGLQIAEKSEHPRVRVVVLSDMQNTNWVDGTRARLKQRGHLLQIETLTADQTNLALRDAQLIPAQPIVKQPVRLVASVTNYSDAAQQAVVRFETQTQTQLIAPRRSATFTFEVIFDDIDETKLELSLETNDAFAYDNTVGLSVKPIAARPVTLVTLAANNDPQTATYFASRALSPTDIEGVALRIEAPGHLPVMSPEPAGIWLLLEAGALDDAMLAALSRQAASGGGVVWVIDSQAAAESANRWQASPLTALKIQNTTTSKSGGEAKFDQAVLAVFEGPGRTALLDQHFSSVASSLVKEDAEVWWADAQGHPLLATNWHGAGRVVLFGVDLSPRNSSFVKQPVFPVLLHQLVHHLAPGPLPRALLQPGDLDVSSQPIRQLGWIDARSGPAWVALNPKESDLLPAELTSISAVDAPPISAGTFAMQQSRRELWPMLMVIALLLLIIESGSLLWWSKRGEASHV